MEKSYEEIKEQTQKESSQEQPSLKETVEHKEKVSENIELHEKAKEARGEIEKEIEKIRLSPQAKVQIQKQAEDIKKQAVKSKIQHLLDLAQTQGIVFAVAVAKKMNDPYLLDLFHDNLAKQGIFKKFLEKS